MDFDDAMIIGATGIIYNGNLKLVAVYKLSYIFIYLYICIAGECFEIWDIVEGCDWKPKYLSVRK